MPKEKRSKRVQERRRRQQLGDEQTQRSDIVNPETASDNNVWDAVNKLNESLDSVKKQLDSIKSKIKPSSTQNNSSARQQNQERHVQVESLDVDENIVNVETVPTGNDSLLYESYEHFQAYHSLSLDATVTDLKRKEIHENSYVDFATLLPEDPDKSRKLPIVLKGIDNPVLGVDDTSKKSLSLDQWISAFTIYMTIYIEKYKDSGPQMLKYLDVIRDLAKQKGDWQNYDKKFRKSKMQLKLTWGVVHQELYFRCLHEQNKVQDQGSLKYIYNVNQGKMNVQQSQGLPVPIGYCARYHLGNQCLLPCKYNHKCYGCNQLHQASRCPYLNATEQYGNYQGFGAYQPNIFGGGYNQAGFRGFYQNNSGFQNSPGFGQNAYRMNFRYPRTSEPRIPFFRIGNVRDRRPNLRASQIPPFRPRAPNANSSRYFS